MNKEFCLSDKLVDLTGEFLGNIDFALDVEDFQEAVRRLIERKFTIIHQGDEGTCCPMEVISVNALIQEFGEKLTNHSRQTKQNSADGVNESFSKPTANGNIKSDKTADKKLREFIRQFITCGKDNCEGCGEDIIAIIDAVTQVIKTAKKSFDKKEKELEK